MLMFSFLVFFLLILLPFYSLNTPPIPPTTIPTPPAPPYSTTLHAAWQWWTIYYNLKSLKTPHSPPIRRAMVFLLWLIWRKVTTIIPRVYCTTPHSDWLSGAASCREWCLVLGYVPSRKSSVLVSPWLRAPGTVLLSLLWGQMAEHPA